MGLITIILLTVTDDYIFKILQSKSLKPSNNQHTAATAATNKNGHTEQTVASDPTRVTSKRCAHLIAVAMANQLSEVWIANHPILLFIFVTQYAPVFARW